jgi:uncharacterized membrane protein
VEQVIPFALFVSLMLVGLVAGILLATQLGQVRVQRRLGARDFTLVKHEFEVALGRVVTLVFNAPVNSLAARWDSESPPENWEELRAKWHRGQAIRTPLAVAAFAGIALGSVLPGGG